MSASSNIYLPLNFKQLFELVKQLLDKEKQQLIGLLKQEQEETMAIPDADTKVKIYFVIDNIVQNVNAKKAFTS